MKNYIVIVYTSDSPGRFLTTIENGMPTFVKGKTDRENLEEAISEKFVELFDINLNDVISRVMADYDYISKEDMFGKGLTYSVFEMWCLDHDQFFSYNKKNTPVQWMTRDQILASNMDDNQKEILKENFQD